MTPHGAGVVNHQLVCIHIREKVTRPEVGVNQTGLNGAASTLHWPEQSRHDLLEKILLQSVQLIVLSMDQLLLVEHFTHHVREQILPCILKIIIVLHEG